MAGSKFKPQFRRLLFIDRTIREGRYPSAATLAGEWEVSAKTIQRDIEYLRDELEAPIAYDGVKHGLYYTDPAWFLPSVMLSEGDILALLIGTQALNMYKGTPVASELKAIYGKLAELLPAQISIAPELIFNRFSFNNAPARPIDENVWKLLIRGLLHQRVTEIDYASPHSTKPKRHTIHPLHLANIEGDWYLLAYATRWDDLAQFAVSRVRKVDLLEATFTPPKDFNAGTLLEARFGKFVHMKGGRSLTVRVVFRSRIAVSVAERSWHPRQKARFLKNGRLAIEFPVADVRDVVPWVLSWGDNVARVEPKALRDAVVAEAQCLARLR
jgi:predicted DNA-binding transcriptional regulator YafY